MNDFRPWTFGLLRGTSVNIYSRNVVGVLIAEPRYPHCLMVRHFLLTNL
jgi:hypothetical protein